MSVKKQGWAGGYWCRDEGSVASNPVIYNIYWGFTTQHGILYLTASGYVRL